MSDVNKEVVGDDSADEQTGGGEADPVKNLKSEIYRKLDNQNSKLDQYQQSLNAIMEDVRSRIAPKEEPQQNLKDLAFDDPEAYAKIVTDRAVKEATRQVTQQVQIGEQTRSTIVDIQGKYPEFSQEGSEATQLAIQKAASLPKHLRGTPEGAKMAMLEAAAELGLVPSSRRQKANEDFSVSGSSNPPSRSRKQDPVKEIDAVTLEWAKLLDPSISDDPKRIENLKKAQNRKSWSKYE